jgi:hypothetical protein
VRAVGRWLELNKREGPILRCTAIELLLTPLPVTLSLEVTSRAGLVSLHATRRGAAAQQHGATEQQRTMSPVKRGLI